MQWAFKTGIMNPRRACSARVMVVVPCVRVFVDYYSHTTGNDVAYEGYQQL